MSAPSAAPPAIAGGAICQTTLCGAFHATVEAHADECAFRLDGGDSITWREYGDVVRRTAAGLRARGLRRGDVLGLLLSNRLEFHVLDAAALQLGVVTVSLYATLAPEQMRALLADCRPSLLVTEEDLIGLAREATAGDPGAPELVSVEDGVYEAEDDVDWRAVEPDDVATLIYTSGTTGRSKGVQVTHANLMALARSWDRGPGLPKRPRIVSYLPMAHIAERVCSHYLPMVTGAEVTACANVRELAVALPAVRPTLFFSVPRIWEKLQTLIVAGIDSHEPPKRAAVHRALDLGYRVVDLEQAGQPVPDELVREHAQADALELAPIRELLGLDQVEHAYVGAAPSSPRLLRFFHALGIRVAEVWGMSETCGVTAANPPGQPRIGTVGRPLPGLRVEIDVDGEILVNSPTVMKGYRGGRERDTTVPGCWLRTGDLGSIDEHGFLSIVGRKKDLIVDAFGKNIAPGPIEAALVAESGLIAHACCVGDGRPCLVALVALDPDAAAASADPEEEVARAVQQVNARTSRPETIRQFAIVPDTWEPGGNELTPTSKVRRAAVEQRYATAIATLYCEAAAAREAAALGLAGA